MPNLIKPKFYLKVLNGWSMAFGIQVYLDSNRAFSLFDQYSTPTYDHRKDLFKNFVNAENLDLLDFSFEIFHNDQYMGYSRFGSLSYKENHGAKDCRSWIWDYNGMRKKVLTGNGIESEAGGKVIMQ